MSKFIKVLSDWEKTVKTYEREAKKCERLLTKIVKDTTLDYSRHKRLNRHFGEIMNIYPYDFDLRSIFRMF